MNKFILYVGLNDKVTKTQLIDTLTAYNLVNNLILNYVDGVTITQGKGIYKHQNGNITIENTFIIELLFTDKTTVNTIADDLKRILNQESIAIQELKVDSYLY